MVLLKQPLLYSSKKLLFGYLAWWLFWTILHAFAVHMIGITWAYAFVDAFIFNVFMAIVCLIPFFLYRFYQPRKENRVYMLIFAIIITYAYCSLAQLVLKNLMESQASYLQFLDQSMPIRFVIGLLMLSMVTLLYWLLDKLEEQHHLTAKQSETEQLAREAELVKLRQQLQPHFLFNSLNSISALAVIQPQEARKMIQQLSDFLRGTLKRDEEKTVTLKEELEHLKLYLEIEKVRFGHRLQVNIDNENNTTELKLPPLILQPLVENAIKFGLYGTIDDVVINIKSSQSNHNLLVSISNPYDEQIQSSSKGTGFGLNSVQRRLFLIYSRTDLIETEKKNNMFSLTLKIPQA
jgi:two-component system, LytTR family, sensor kinase